MCGRNDQIRDIKRSMINDNEANISIINGNNGQMSVISDNEGKMLEINDNNGQISVTSDKEGELVRD